MQIKDRQPKINRLIGEIVDMEKMHPTVLLMFLGGLVSIVVGVYAPQHTPIELRAMAISAGVGAVGAVGGITNQSK